MLKKLSKRFFPEVDLKSLILLIVGTISWSLTMVKSSLEYSFGAGFWGANGHDGIWHIALARSIVRDLGTTTFWNIPIFAGEMLKNYHIGFDLILAFIHLVTKIPVTTLYFQVFPPILAFLIGFLCWIFVYSWRGSKKEAFWATFFVYFGGSLGWIVTLIRELKLGGESMFWSQQSISTLINPPFAMSLVFLFAGLIFIIKSLNNQGKNRFYIFASIVLLGCLVNIKVYSGLLVLIALFTSGAFLYTRKKDLRLLKIFVGVLLLSIFIFLPSMRTSGSLIIFRPFWFLETMLGISDRFHWPRLYEAIMNYKLGRVWYKLIPAYFISLAIFKLGNLGTRVIAIRYFFENVRNIKGINWIDVFLTTIISAGAIVPLFFLQSGTPWNTIQFFYYSLIFLGILAGISLAHSKKWLIVAMFLFTIPTTLATLLNDYLPSRPPAKISTEELKALRFLEHQENGVVLTFNYDENKAKEAQNNPPRPLYLYESTAYVSAYANKLVYLEDQVNLDITGYLWRERRQKVDDFSKATNETEAINFLKENNIKYLYLVKVLSPNPGEVLKIGPQQLGLNQIFENNEVIIYSTNN